MITTSTENIRVSKPATITRNKEIEVYTCSDGRKYTNEKDREINLGFQQAERWEEHSYDNRWNEPNEGYDPTFYFYFNHDLSKETKYVLSQLVFEISHVKMNEMKDGWYYVNQSVYCYDNGSMSGEMKSSGSFYRLEDEIETVEKRVERLKNRLNDLNSEL